MQHLNRGNSEQNMASAAARLESKPRSTTRADELPAVYDCAVLRFDPDAAADAFDILGRGGQYAIVGKLTYALTPTHVALLKEAGIPYELQSVR